jgi:hypothetical protein
LGLAVLLRQAALEMQQARAGTEQFQVSVHPHQYPQLEVLPVVP